MHAYKENRAPVDLITDSLLLITTNGRKSGDKEINFLVYRQDGDRYIVAATTDRGQKPNWYLNLKEDPIVELEVKGEHFNARATTPVGRERLRVWHLVEEISSAARDEVPRHTTAVVLTPTR